MANFYIDRKEQEPESDRGTGLPIMGSMIISGADRRIKLKDMPARGP